MKLNRKKVIAGIAVAAAAVATLTLAGAANASNPVSTTKSRVGYNYGCEIPVKGSSVPLLDIHGPYTGHNACGAGHQLDVIWMGPLPTTTGPKGATGATGATGAKGATGATGAAGTNGTNGTNAQALPYGIALVDVSRGGATATTWGSYSTTIGSPVGDTASGVFRMSCSAAKAPCVISVQAYSTTSGVTVYPRLDISRQDTNGVPTGNCEYADGVDNNNSASPELSHDAANPSVIKLGIGGTLDCGAGQAYPTDGIATSISVPAGFYDVDATFVFKK